MIASSSSSSQEGEREAEISSDHGWQVVIIGAGLAGLAAAQRLEQLGFDRVLILEGQARVGGRVHTVAHGEFVLELGAQWLHGAHENPLYKQLAALELLEGFEPASDAFEGHFCTDAGRQLDRQLVRRVLAILSQSKLALFKTGEPVDANNNNNNSEANNSSNSHGHSHRRPAPSASELFRGHLAAAIASDRWLAGHEPLVWALFEWFLRFETIENGCNSMDEVSLHSYTHWSDLGEGALLNFKRGYSSLVEWLRPGCRVELNTRVLGVELMPAAGQATFPVAVSYQRRDTGERGVARCERAILTSSLGHLKEQLERGFFKPPLAADKCQLIRTLGFGTVNKILLQFQRPFWRGAAIKLVWTGEAAAEAPPLPRWTRDILAFDTVRRQPQLLIGWIGGEGARQMELASDGEVGAACVALLERFVPGQASALVRCVCSRWYSDELFRGSYSFRSQAEGRAPHVDRLHEPVRDARQVARVLFAGEATAGHAYSTTHGAVLSGWREAERVAANK